MTMCPIPRAAAAAVSSFALDAPTGSATALDATG